MSLLTQATAESLPPSQNLGLLAQQQAALAQPGPQVASVAGKFTDLGLVTPDQMAKAVGAKKIDPELERQADDFVGKLLDIKVGDAEQEDQGQASIENIGANIVRRASQANSLLKQPLKNLGQIGGGEGQEIAKQLTDLKVQFDLVDPARYNFKEGWLGRTLSRVPGLGTPLNRYFTQFQSSGSVIESLFDSLEVSKEQLLRDIDTLRSEQVTMRSETKRLQNLIITCQLIDQKLVAKVGTMDQQSDEAKYINTKLLFPLRQRITDLQQQLIVNQQGVLMFEVLVENNKELVRGVNRCKNVTYPALLIGITAAQALANQKIVLNKIQALDEVGNRSIAFNAQLLKTQGVEIHKLAASAQLSDAGLAQAMKDAIQALNDVEQFRLKALDQMGSAIKERDGLTAQGEKAIQQIERGNKAVIQLGFDKDVETSGPKNK